MWIRSKSVVPLVVLLAGSSLLAGCSIVQVHRPVPQDAPIAVESAPLPGTEIRNADIRRVGAIDRKLAFALKSFREVTAEALQEHASLGYFSNLQHAKLERSFVQFRDLRRQLREIREKYAGWPLPQRGQKLAGAGELEAGLIRVYADHAAMYATGAAVVAIQADATLVAKFNEAFLASKEPRGTYDRLFHEVTSDTNWRTRNREWSAASKMQNALVSREYQIAFERCNELHVNSRRIRRAVIRRGYAIIPEVSNVLHHTQLAAWLRSNRTGISDRLRSARDKLYEEIGDLPVPGEDLTEFSPAQARMLRRMLRPGDVILTYTGGYLSNVFLPGNFKHAITFVGNNGARKRAGLYSLHPHEPAGADLEALQEQLQIDKIPGPHGQMPADVIEAVAEGVIFNSFRHLLDTHVTRIVALRPEISDEERREFLLRVFSLLGTKYDFAFDFSDASSHCCTEVVYRALNNTGKIRFPLARRGGYYNLSGDEILQSYLATPGAFDIVFLALPKGEGSNKARIFKGNAAVKALRELVR